MVTLLRATNRTVTPRDNRGTGRRPGDGPLRGEEPDRGRGGRDHADRERRRPDAAQPVRAGRGLPPAGLPRLHRASPGGQGRPQRQARQHPHGPARAARAGPARSRRRRAVDGRRGRAGQGEGPARADRGGAGPSGVEPPRRRHRHRAPHRPAPPGGGLRRGGGRAGGQGPARDRVGQREPVQGQAPARSRLQGGRPPERAVPRGGGRALHAGRRGGRGMQPTPDATPRGRGRPAAPSSR